MAKLEIDKFNKQVNIYLTKQIDDSVNIIMQNIYERIKQANLEFFKLLARTDPSTIIGSDGPPGLTGVGPPKWQPLSDAYTKKRWKGGYGRRVAKSKFYVSGGSKNPLATTLASIDYETVFGVPTIAYKILNAPDGVDDVRFIDEGGALQRGRDDVLNLMGTKNIPDKMVAQLQLNPYPVLPNFEDIVGNLENQSTEVERLLWDEDPENLVAAKLSNPGPGRGGGRARRLRPILGRYMTWWMKVKLGNIMKGELK